MASKEFITGLIELYRNKPCLWRTTCAEYTNKNVKNESYKELVAYSKRFFKEADRQFVQQKIQNLRTAFRKELKKIEDSKRGGADDIYVPKLWYFDLLLFTSNDELPRRSLDRRKICSSTNISGIIDRSDVDMSEQDSEEECEEIIEGQTSPGTSTPTKKVFKSPPTPRRKAAEKRRLARKKEDNFLTSWSNALNKLSSENCNNPRVRQVEDEFDAIGISWASKLRKLDDVQRVLAEDLVNQTLKKAFFGELTRNTTIQEVQGSVITPPTSSDPSNNIAR